MYDDMAEDLIAARDLAGLERLFNDEVFEGVLQYHEGILSRKELGIPMISGVYLDGALYKLGLRIRLTYSQVYLGRFEDYGLWLGFKEDLALFEEGLPARPRERDWLVRLEDGGAACAEDKALVMGAFKAMRVPLSAVEACPPGVFNKRDEVTHAWNGSTAHLLGYDCVDDGGLCADPSPLGRTFSLVDTRGIHAQVTIIEDRRGGDRRGLEDIDQCLGLAAFVGEGWIEGHTAQSGRDDPRIAVRLDSSGRIKKLGYRSTAADQSAVGASPMWGGYGEWIAENNRRVSAELDSLMDQYLHRLYACEVVAGERRGSVCAVELPGEAAGEAGARYADPISVTVDFGDCFTTFSYPEEFQEACSVVRSPFDEC